MSGAQTAAARPAWPEYLATVGLGLAFTWKLAFTNLILARGDTFLYFYPLWDYRARALQAGRLPLWTPELFMGAPFLANSQTGVFYPLNWPLSFWPAPAAVKIALIGHLLLAALGAQVLARTRLGLARPAGLVTAVVFALGGYLTAQAEHINQLQALAWFPWLLWALGIAQPRRRLAALAGLLTMQLLAGHMQSVVISAAGAGLYVLVTEWGRDRWRLIQALGVFAGAGLLAGLLAAAQLLPTAELSRESLRNGGLPWREALSFSLDPRLLGLALLPGYSRSIFSEYVGYAGVAALMLAALGITRRRGALAALALTVIGLAFALGAYDPMYAALAAVPPFNLFRVPARWLVLSAFGAALLAGYGLDRLATLTTKRARLWPALVPLALLALTPLAGALTPPGETGPLGLPAASDFMGWGVALGLTVLSLGWLAPRWRTPALMGVMLIELFAAAQALPYNHLTAPEAYTSRRPAAAQLLAAAQNEGNPPDRFLSMSALRFDPGDLGELHSAYDAQLPADAVYDLIVATKHQEVLSPNLPLTWGAPAVDGFDGGILPLRHYAAFTQLFTGAASADGRLRENLTAAPDNRLLSLVNARWLITDKVQDAWVDGVFYDQQFTLTLAAGETFAIARLPVFEATALGLVTETPGGRVQVETPTGEKLDLALNGPRVELGRAATPARVTLIGPLSIRGLSLIDTRTGAFQTLTLGPYRLAHSGDVKVYENLAVLPRAFVAGAARIESDEAAARAQLAAPSFDPAQQVILAAGTPLQNGVAGPARIEHYTPEAVTLTASGPGYLVLTDAYFPGWTAAIDGSPAPILRADIAFRAVALPAGAHTVTMEFKPASARWGVGLSALGLAILGLLLFWPEKAINRPPRRGATERA